MSAFHRWLLKHRPYCEIGSCMVPSTRVIRIDNKSRCVCDAHFASHHPLRAGYEKRKQQIWPPVEYYIERWNQPEKQQPVWKPVPAPPDKSPLAEIIKENLRRDAGNTCRNFRTKNQNPRKKWS